MVRTVENNGRYMLTLGCHIQQRCGLTNSAVHEVEIFGRTTHFGQKFWQAVTDFGRQTLCVLRISILPLNFLKMGVFSPWFYLFGLQFFDKKIIQQFSNSLEVGSRGNQRRHFSVGLHIYLVIVLLSFSLWCHRRQLNSNYLVRCSTLRQ